VDSSPYCRDTSHSISRQEVGMAGNHSKSGLAQTPEIRPQLSTRPTYQFPGRTPSLAAGRVGCGWCETVVLMPVGYGDLFAFFHLR